MPELPPQNTASSAPAAPAAPETKVPQTSIAAELSRVYDEKAAAAKSTEKPADKESRGTPITGGQGNVAPETKARGEDGRFASTKAPDAKDAKPDAKPAADPKAAAKAEDAKPDAKADAKAVADKEAADKAKAVEIKPHPRWKPEVQEKFTKLAAADPDLAKFVLEHQKEGEKQFHQGRQALAVAEKFKGLDDVLAAGRQQRSMQGVDDPTFMRSLVAASDFLAKEPQKGLRMLAEQYGVDLKELAEGKAEVQDSPQIRALEQRLAQQEKFIQSFMQGSKQHNEQAAMHSIESFKQQKDEQGQLLYPHFDEVVDDVCVAVAHQLQNGQRPDLKAAYVKAIRLNEGVWTKLQAAKSDAERKRREDEEAQRVRDAKLAGFSASGSGGGGSEVAGSIRDELRRQVEKSYR